MICCNVEVPSTRSPFACKAMGVPEISVESSPGAIDFPSKRIPLNDDNACITCPCIVVAKGVNAAAGPSPMDASLGQLGQVADQRMKRLSEGLR